MYIDGILITLITRQFSLFNMLATNAFIFWNHLESDSYFWLDEVVNWHFYGTVEADAQENWKAWKRSCYSYHIFKRKVQNSINFGGVIHFQITVVSLSIWELRSTRLKEK